MPEWLLLLRGIYSVLTSVGQWLQAGPMAPILGGAKPTIVYSNNPNDFRLAALLPLLYTSISTSPERQAEIDIYRIALDELRRASCLPYSPSGSINMRSAPYRFLVRVPQAYITLLDQRRPDALVLMAYHCVLLKHAEPCWHVDGHARRMLTIIHEQLNEEWRRWIE